VESARLFDVYAGDRIGPGKRSLAHRFVLRAPDRTLREEEIQQTLAKMLDAARGKHAAALRT
jgi:phenylalanyl-tRNA synthetase beta chain